MTDRKMLELAARAGGIKLEWNDKGESGYWEDWRGLPNWEPWNPRDYDGDAFRLQVALQFVPEFGNDAITIWPVKERYTTRVDGASTLDERCAATRLAITRAAAEIGRQMEESND